MNDFDDERLRSEFNRRAGRGVSVAAAHDAVLTRAGLVRRRRVAVAGSGALIALVVGGLVLLPGADDGSQAPADTGRPIPSVEDEIVIDDLPTSTTARDPDRSEVDGAAPPPLTDSTTTTDSSGRPGSTVPAVAATTSNPPPPTASTAPTTTAPPHESSTTTTVGASGSSPSSSSSTSIPVSSVAPFTESYDSAGGSITVAWDGSSFSLLAVTPASGFEAEIEDQRATRIRVRFRSDDDDSRIEVRVENGQLAVDIS
jgi:hypothetical protein